MPFLSSSQARACFTQKAKGGAKGWNCQEWADKTKSIKALPESVKRASLSFSKIAEALFNPAENPPVPEPILVQKAINDAKAQKFKGRSPVEYRRETYMKRQGIYQRNKESSTK